jgi:hypothetical protein
VSRFGDKLSVWCRGPYRVVGFETDFVYKVQNLLDEKDIEETHIARLKFYAKKDMNISETLLDLPSSVIHEDALEFFKQ